MDEPDSLQVESRAGGLIIRLHGRGIIDRKEATVRAILKVVDEHQPRAVLIDLLAVPGPFIFMDRYQLGELAGRYFSGKSIAALIHEGQANHDRIGKLVAANRGALVEVFTDSAAAETWLKKHSGSKPVG